MGKNVLFLMCDQFRYDCIAALGNPVIKTPNLDRLAQRGTAFTKAYSSCPVCVPARYNLMTGREPAVTGCFANDPPRALGTLSPDIQDRCGEYLPARMRRAGYRTFGIGKFHTKPDCYEDLGFETHLHTEELWETAGIKQRDAYAGFMMREHPEYGHIDQLHGERTNMYYVPQTSPFPPELTVESFVADRTVEQLQMTDDERPWFGFVSFIGPHPPCAPPVPYNLMYDPDVFPAPIRGERDSDLLDEQLSFMNYAIWADDISVGMTRNILSRYYGEISYIDACIGKILDAVDRRPDARDTVICFFSDHGDHLGDHQAWQKESFYESSARIPFILCAPDLVPAGEVRQDFATLTDLFGIATGAAGVPEVRDGVNLLAGERRESVTGVYQRPGSLHFKLMYREGPYKYIYMANGGREQLFDLEKDPEERMNLAGLDPEETSRQRNLALAWCAASGMTEALDGDRFKAFPFTERPRVRIHQFEFSRNIEDFKVSSHNFFVAL